MLWCSNTRSRIDTIIAPRSKSSSSVMYMLPPPFFQREEKKLAPFKKRKQPPFRLRNGVAVRTWFVCVSTRFRCPLGNGFHRYHFLSYHTLIFLSRLNHQKQQLDLYLSRIERSCLPFFFFRLEYIAEVFF